MRIKRLIRILPMLVLDLIGIALIGMMILSLQGVDTADFWRYYPILATGTVLIFYFSGLYAGIWQFVGMLDIGRICFGVSATTVLYYLGSTYWLEMGQHKMFYILFAVLFGLYVTMLRMYIKIQQSFRRMIRYLGKPMTNIMIIGGGEAGRFISSEIANSMYYEDSRAVCIIDDDPMNFGRQINGVRIYGGRDKIIEAAKKFHVDTIIFAIPSCPEKERIEILKLCKETGCHLKTLPTLQDLDGSLKIGQVRTVEIEDLLGREPIQMALDDIMDYVTDRTVLVTGGGGSIGSELCRQIARYQPKLLILFDIYENTTYQVQLELQRKFPELRLVVLIGSVRDEKRVEAMLEQYRPDIIYHAAAHKHVPLMEDSPAESVKNNVFGTLNLVKAADRCHVKRFILISTDKAVNPTNVMGATKRICEMIVQSYDKMSETEYVAVRFGNVLGSHGSVIPLFKKQIAAGGPVTVTNREITRYFMTIPEAVSLVLQAGALAKGGEIFVLDMGRPMKILDLAENIIRLSGFEPYQDIDIQFTGLRPGEKLYEELLMDEEGLSSTSNELIHIGKPLNIDQDVFFAGLEHLHEQIQKEDCDIRAELKAIVSTYHPVNISSDGAEC